MDENAFETLQRYNEPLYRLFEKAAKAVVAKNHDYAGKGQDFYRNLKASERWGFPGWKAVFVRLGDKISRIESFIMQGEFMVKDENFIDTCIDAAVYFLIMADMWLRSKLEKETEMPTMTYIPKNPSQFPPSTSLEDYQGILRTDKEIFIRNA